MPCPATDALRLFNSHDALHAAQVLGSQIYLATPSDCPVHADGSKRRASGGGGRSVSLLVSTDEALTFAEACIPIRFLDQVRTSAWPFHVVQVSNSLLTALPQRVLPKISANQNRVWTVEQY